MAKWEFFKSKTLGEVEKRNNELIEKSEVISENKEKNRKLMKAPDGHIFMTHIEWTPRPSLYGVAVTTEGDVTPDEIEKAKEMVLEEVIKCIRDIAKKKPDEFFMIHTPSQNPLKNLVTDEVSNMSSVGAKFALPTVLDDEEANGRI
jgi:hypothetical protein